MSTSSGNQTDAPRVKSKRIELSDYLLASSQMDLTVLLACHF